MDKCGEIGVKLAELWKEFTTYRHFCTRHHRKKNVERLEPHSRAKRLKPAGSFFSWDASELDAGQPSGLDTHGRDGHDIGS